MTTQHDPCARAGSYQEHASRLHAAASDAHRRWLAELPPEDRAKVEALDLGAYPDDDAEVGGHSPFSVSDIADTSLARTDTDFAAAIDTPSQILADEFDIPLPLAQRLHAWHTRETSAAVIQEKAHYLQLIVGGLLSNKNPKLNAAGLAFAANLGALNGLPCQRQYARENHVSPSAISKLVVAWQRTLGIAPSTHQKSAAACETYSRVGKKSHWRARTITASAAARILSRTTPPQHPDHN